MTADLAIVGGGPGATLVVDALRRLRLQRPLRVTVYEPADRPGRGVPYRTDDPAHRMNVPAIRLSVDPDDPDHLLRWLRHKGRPSEAGDHIARGLYGSYLEAVFAGSIDGDRNVSVTVVRARVTGIERCPQGFALATGAAPPGMASRVVLAVGGPSAPTSLPIDERLAGDPAVVLDPWAPGALTAPDHDDGDAGAGRRYLIVGSGLTMVDVALTVLRRPGTTVEAISRHGLLPRVHPAVRQRAELPIDLPPGPLSAAQVRRALVDHVRREPNGWAASVDLFRDASDELWPRLPVPEQAKLLRRMLTTWNVHRHRMSPAVAAELNTVMDAGRLRIHAGRVTSVTRSGGQIAVEHHPEGRPWNVATGHRLVVCTGPATDIGRTTDPLVRHLLDTGVATVGPHRLGLAVDGGGTVVDGRGRPVEGLTVIGALRKGTVFETTAIPELRVQAATLALRFVTPVAA